MPVQSSSDGGVTMRSKRNRGRIATFLRKHKGWLSFIGAAIVFMTFVVKDNVREHFRELTSTFDAAERLLAIRKDTMAANTKLAALEKKIDFIQQDVTSISKGEGTWRYGVNAPVDT